MMKRLHLTGGMIMNPESIKNNDSIQLKQMIIFLRAELSKAEQKVQEYETGYLNSIIENLEQENAKLIKENNDLNQKFRQVQKKNFRPFVETMRQSKVEWLPVNKQLYEVEKLIKKSEEAKQKEYANLEQQMSALKQQFTESKSTFEQIENRLISLLQKSMHQVHTEIENLRVINEKQVQFEQKEQRLLKDIEDQKYLIQILEQEIKDLKAEQQKSMETVQSDDQYAFVMELLLHVEEQIKEIEAKSLEYEQNLEAKLAIIQVLEHKLKRLTVEIEEIEGNEK